MKKILIVEEINTHSECLTLFSDVFNEDGIYPKYLLDDQVISAVKSKDIFKFCGKLHNFILKDKNKFFKAFFLFSNHLKFVRRAFHIKKIMKKENPDFTIFNTIGYSPNLPTILLLNGMGLKNKLILTLHGTNLSDDKVGIFERVTNYYLKKLILKQNATIILLGKYIDKKQIGANNYFYLNNQRLENLNHRKNNRVTFSVVGRGKDYAKILDSFSNIKSDNFIINIFLRCLADLQELQNLLKNSKIKDNIKIFFDVNEKKLKLELSKSHYLLSPLKKIEGYGEFRISGNYGDALSLKLPIILPSWYGKNFKFGKNIIKYKRLDKILDDLIKLKGYPERIRDLTAERREYKKDIRLFLNYIKA